MSLSFLPGVIKLPFCPPWVTIDRWRIGAQPASLVKKNYSKGCKQQWRGVAEKDASVSLPPEFKAVPAAPPRWNVSIVISKGGCEGVRCERSKSEDEERKILRSEGVPGVGGSRSGQMKGVQTVVLLSTMWISPSSEVLNK